EPFGGRRDGPTAVRHETLDDARAGRPVAPAKLDDHAGRRGFASDNTLVDRVHVSLLSTPQARGSGFPEPPGRRRGAMRSLEILQTLHQQAGPDIPIPSLTRWHRNHVVEVGAIVACGFVCALGSRVTIAPYACNVIEIGRAHV